MSITFTLALHIFYITPIVDFTHQCDNKIIAKEKMWLKENEECYEIHRKNADIDAGSFDDEDLDYRNMMEHMVKQRNRRNPVCVQLNREINDKAKKKLTDYLEIGAKHLIEERTPLDMSFVFQLQNVLKNKPELFYKKRVPQPSKEISMNEKIIPQIDNDIEGTEMSFGFQSAIDVATRTIDEIHTT